MTVKFSDNAVALINKNTGEPLGQKYDQNSNLIAKEVEKYFPKWLLLQIREYKLCSYDI